MTTRMLAGRYRLDAALGSGGMGTVWSAVDTVLDRPVAVKELRPMAGGEDPAVLRERVLREARTVARLSDPALITVYDVLDDEFGRPFIVMELVPGRALSQVVALDGPLTPPLTARVGLAVLGALEVAHGAGVVHRDVKPGNVLLADPPGRGRVWLTDFGIAAPVVASEVDPELTSTGLLVGSPAYLAPERARGMRSGPQADLFSLGATLWTAVEGVAPFTGRSALDVLLAVTRSEVPAARLAGPLEPVLRQLLAADPAERPVAAQVRAALRAVADGTAATLPTTRLRTGGAPSPAGATVVRPADLGGGDADGTRTRALPVADPRPGPDRPPLPPPGSGPAHREPAPAARSRRRRSRGGRARGPLIAAGAVALLTAGAVVAGVELTSAPLPPASTTAATVPSAWRAYAGPNWTQRVPPTWTVTNNTSSVTFFDPATKSYLQISSQSASSPGSALVAFERSFAAGHSAYSRVSLTSGPGALADLEFTYIDQIPLHTRVRAVQSGATCYLLYFQTHEPQWAGSQATFNELMAGFTPAR